MAKKSVPSLRTTSWKTKATGNENDMLIETKKLQRFTELSNTLIEAK